MALFATPATANVYDDRAIADCANFGEFGHGECLFRSNLAHATLDAVSAVYGTFGQRVVELCMSQNGYTPAIAACAMDAVDSAVDHFHPYNREQLETHRMWAFSLLPDYVVGGLTPVWVLDLDTVRSVVSEVAK